MLWLIVAVWCGDHFTLNKKMKRWGGGERNEKRSSCRDDDALPDVRPSACLPFVRIPFSGYGHPPSYPDHDFKSSHGWGCQYKQDIKYLLLFVCWFVFLLKVLFTELFMQASVCTCAKADALACRLSLWQCSQR